MRRSPEQFGFVEQEQESSMPFVTREASKSHKKNGGELPGWLQLTKEEKIQLIDAITSTGVVPVLEQFPNYQEALDLKREKDISGVYLDMINTIRLAYGLPEYVPPVESPDPEEAQESGEVSVHEMTWQKPRNEKNGEPDPKQQPGHIRLTNNEFNNELTLGKGDKESGRDPSTYIIPTCLRLLGIPEGDDKGALEYKLRVAIEANDRNIPAELQNNELTPENRQIWRQKIGLEPLNSEQPQIEEEPEAITSKILDAQAEQSETVGTLIDESDLNIEHNTKSTDSVETPRLTREHFGPMPEDPYDIKTNTDLKALILLFESHPEVFPGGYYIDVREWTSWSPIDFSPNNYSVARGVAEEGSKWSVFDTANNNKVLSEFDTEGEAEREYRRIKDSDRQKALDLIRAARNFAIGKSLDLTWETNLSEGDSYSEDQVISEQAVHDTFRQVFPNLEPHVAPAEEEQLSITGLESYLNKEISPEEIERLKQEAREAYQDYRQYGDTHFRHTRNQASQGEYRKREEIAWAAIDRLAHAKGGKILTLPHQRDIELAHPEQIDLGEKLEDLGYKFNQNGEITHIQLHGNTIKLDRPRSVAELLEGKRPAHIVYGYGESLLPDNDENKYYTGYVLQGLNPQTPDYIIGKLSDKKFLESVIFDPWDLPIDDIIPEQRVETQPLKDTPLLSPDAESRKGNNKDTAIIEQQNIEEFNIQQIQKEQFADLRTQYAKAEEYYNRNRGDEVAKSELLRLREAYNQTVEKVFGIMAAEGLESEIHKIFVQEVKNLREERIVQSQELQSGFEKAINPLKEKFVNFAIKHKKVWAITNISLAVAGGMMAFTGVGLPVAGALEATRRSIGSIMTGVTVRESVRGLKEDADIKLGKIKWQAAIPKLVGESLQEGYIKNAKNADLSTKLSTLEAYYRLNGGKFTNESQQTAYESILTELGIRVQHESIINQAEKEIVPVNISEIENTNSTSSLDEGIQESAIVQNDTENVSSQSEKFQFSSPEYNQQYTSRLLTALSEKRISELQKQQRNRTIANVVGTVAGGSLMSLLVADTMRPGGIFNPEQVTNTPKPDITDTPDKPIGTPQPNVETTPPPAPKLPTPEGTGTATSEAAQNLSPEQVKDISELSRGETLSGEIAKKLGADATELQKQQVLETYMHTSQGSETIFNLASQTEQGKALLSELGVDNAQELSQLSNANLYEITQHLGTGELKGLDSLDLQDITVDNIDTDTASAVIPPIEVVSVTTATPEQLLNKFSQAPDILDFPEGAKPLTQFDNYIDRFAGDLSYDSSLGQEVLNAYIDTPAGKNWIYDAIVSNPNPNNQNVQLFREYLSFKGIKSAEDFNRIFNWAEFSSDNRIPTSGFWKPVKLPNTTNIIQPLSTFLQPGKMIGIREAVRQVLTR